MTSSSFRLCAITLGLLSILSTLCVCQSPDQGLTNEQQMFTSLYAGVEEMVIPSYHQTAGSPTQVILFEMPGTAINRDGYDPLRWAAGGFDARQPDAVAAAFADRLPYYTGPIFVDSGSSISNLWSHFIYQYIIPIVDDPIQTKKVNDARAALANGTLEATYDAASAAYQQAFSELTTFRTDCLAKQTGAGGGVCSAEGVIYRERLKRKWFNLEVARRDIAAAEAKIIALQIQDMKNIFADSLYAYASSERVDMGASGFGQSYYLTYFTPSTFWRWWPTTGLYDYSVYADGSTVNLPINGTIIQNPINGVLNDLGNGSFSYRPNPGYTGSDRVGYSFVNGAGTTTNKFYSIQVVGNDVTAADTAFVSVSVSSGSSSFSSSSFSSSFSTSSSFGVSYGFFSASGSLATSNSKSSATAESMSASFSMAFSLARVQITRPWLDTSLLSFYPVAIRNLAANAWSDGTLTPPSGPLQFKFKLLPVAALVARDVKITTSFSSSFQSLVTSSQSVSASLKVGYGPFFSGSTSVNSASSSRDYHESSSYNNGVLSIRGPQVIGWVCVAIPPFPNASEEEVRKWELDQVKRQEDINSGKTPSS